MDPPLKNWFTAKDVKSFREDWTESDFELKEEEMEEEEEEEMEMEDGVGETGMVAQLVKKLKDAHQRLIKTIQKSPPPRERLQPWHIADCLKVLTDGVVCLDNVIMNRRKEESVPPSLASNRCYATTLSMPDDHQLLTNKMEQVCSDIKQLCHQLFQTVAAPAQDRTDPVGNSHHHHHG